MKNFVVFLSSLFLCFFLVACGSPKAPRSAQDYIGLNYETVINEFEKAGFSNIETEELQDLNSNSELPDGGVSSVSINGQKEFEKGIKFAKDSPVLITFHTIPKISSPLSTFDIQDTDYEVVASTFKAAGFENVSTNVVYDLDPDVCESPFETKIEIDSLYYIEKGDPIPYDADITVVCHLPYEKYSVKVSINFTSNLIFSKYGVVFSMNGEEYKLDHGEDGEYEYRLKPGSYTLSFTSRESSSVKGETNLDVTCDTEAEYTISCHSDEISVFNNHVFRLQEASENEVMVQASNRDLKDVHYEEVVDTLKSWGFVNISTVPHYDIYFGITEVGATGTVTIDGRADFVRGDLFQKDVPIVVNYHLKEEDAPTAPAGDIDWGPENSLFYSTNDYETAKKGNSGVFSYKNKGGSYDVYWIIDFDEGFVYYFTEGNGESTCDKLKIVSGTLNDKIKVTWHDGGDQWSWHLHFKYVNSPVTLVVNDHNGSLLNLLQQI